MKNNKTMLLASLPAFADLMDLVRAVDKDAVHRMPFLQRLESRLYGCTSMSVAQRESLAEEIERWRYHRLKNCGGSLLESEEALLDMLDLIANVILERPRTLPRRSRLAIQPIRRFWPASSGESVCSIEQRVASVLMPSFPLEQAASWARELTLQHFRDSSLRDTAAPLWRILLYAPLYLSSYCVNHCLHCSFRCPRQIDRTHLTKGAVLNEANILRRRGFRHVLLVAGDFPRLTSTDYFVDLIESLTRRGYRVSIEIPPQSCVSYPKMIRAGACGVTLYQETYQEDAYGRYHPRGPKVWFDWRLEALDRAAEAGAPHLGLGILLGLSDPLDDIWALIRHGQYLQDRFPNVSLAFSLPRIHEVPEGFKSENPINDETLVRMFCALRIAFPAAELVLSTCERPSLRDQLARTCITQMSAGSCTAPRGYSMPKADLRKREQFPVADHRSPYAVAQSLRRAGFEVSYEL